MKFRIEISEALGEEELVLYCRELNESTLELQRRLAGLAGATGTLAVSREDVDYYLSHDEILFFETDENRVAVHTDRQIYYTKQKLYELEESLPSTFLRVSKSTILNTAKIRSIRKNLAGASEVQFAHSLKSAYVSRNYYRLLMDKMAERAGRNMNEK